MYLQHFGLRRSPFTPDPDPRLFHPLRAHVEAIEALAEALRQPEVTVLRGPAGAGRTMIVKTLAAELRERTQVALVERGDRARGGLYDALATAFGVEPGVSTRETRSRVAAVLEHLRTSRRRAAVVVDESDSLPDSWLTEIDELVAAATGVAVVLVAEKRPGALSQRPIAEKVNARAARTIEVGRLAAGECEGFLRALLMAAGARSSNLFESDAIAVLYEMSSGLPGRAAEIADRALLVAYGRAADRIDLESVLAAAEQLAGGRRAPHAGPASGRRQTRASSDGPIELHRHGFGDSSRPPVQWPLRQVVGGDPIETDAVGTQTVSATLGLTGPVAMAGAAPTGTESPVPRPRVIVGPGHGGRVAAGPPGGGESFEDVAPSRPLDPEKEREILAGIRRPDRPSWDRAKHDPYRNVLSQAPPFGPEMLAVIGNPHGTAAEWFRVLRLRLEDWIDAQQESSPIVMVTSAEPEAGKTFISTNLALLFANEPGLRVLLVEADLRRPRYEGLFGVPSRPGLADVLAGRSELGKAVQYISEVGLYVLPGGRPGNPRDLISPDRLAPVMREMREIADLVIFDSPSMKPWVDARSISLVVDGVMMVTRAGRTRAGELIQSLRVLDPDKLIGAVVNDLEDLPRER